MKTYGFGHRQDPSSLGGHKNSERRRTAARGQLRDMVSAFLFHHRLLTVSFPDSPALHLPMAPGAAHFYITSGGLYSPTGLKHGERGLRHCRIYQLWQSWEDASPPCCIEHRGVPLDSLVEWLF